MTSEVFISIKGHHWLKRLINVTRIDRTEFYKPD